MHTAHAEQHYTFGKITYRVGVDGKIDQADSVANHLLAAATAVTSIEAIQCGLTDNQAIDGTMSQDCQASTKFGEIAITVDINFELTQRSSKRMLNSIVFGAVLPKVWQTAALYLGDNATTVTSPPARIPMQYHGQLLSNIDQVLGLQPVPQHLSDMAYGNDAAADQGATRTRQPAAR